MKEIFKDIAGFEGKYQISNLGRVKSFSRRIPKIMKGGMNDQGYKVFTFRINKKRFIRRQHVILYQTHVELINTKIYAVHHVDFDRSNNDLNNLQKILHGEHSTLHLLVRERTEKSKIKMSNTQRKRSKLNIDQVREIKSLFGKLTIKEIAEKYEVSNELIRNIFYGKSWKNT